MHCLSYILIINRTRVYHETDANDQDGSDLTFVLVCVAPKPKILMRGLQRCFYSLPLLAGVCFRLGSCRSCLHEDMT